MAGRRLPLAAAVLRLAAARRGLRRGRLHLGPARVRRPRRLRGVRGRRAPARHAGDHRLRHEPHERPARVVPAVPQGPGRAVRRLLHVGRQRQAVPGRPHHLHRHRDLELDVRPGPQAVLLAPVLLAPARPQLREPGRGGGDRLRPPVLAGPRDRRVQTRRGALPVRGGGHQLREPAAHPPAPQAGPRRDRRALPRHRAARRGQPVARGRRRLLRRLHEGRGRMPHGLPLPRHAAHLHGRTKRVALPRLRNPGQDPGDPGPLPVGHLPAQPRRAHPRDGHGRRARLHVRRVRQGPADAGQHRHPAPARPAPRQRPQPDGAVHRPAAVAARFAGALLRRRDRHGRQHLARRPRRRPHAHAVDPGPQRRFLLLRSGQAEPAGHHGPGPRVPGHQCRGRDGIALLTAALDPQADRDPQGEPGVRTRLVHRTAVVQPCGARLPARARRRPGAVRAQLLPLRAAHRAGPAVVQRAGPGGAHG